MTPQTRAGTDSTSLFREESNSSASEVHTSQQGSGSISSSAQSVPEPQIILLPSQPLHTYVYQDKKRIDVADPSKYKSKSLIKYHNFTCALEWKYRLNLQKFNTHETRVIYTTNLLDSTSVTTWATQEQELECANDEIT
ncbi:hypothetical protein EMPG_12436 [Blastomyces silverae]|uniref:Uncharacterized protein n=1 Tax=Blastomyces silverae TaxID=2060906 RepID=A0A0H1BTY6_9EURO|nr:hypothetical protein EMPG_12436 [Blastomyces silverae]